jgi:IS5 family transposase
MPSFQAHHQSKPDQMSPIHAADPSVCADTRSGICLGFVLAQANHHDSPLLVPTLDTLKRLPFDFTGTKVHLDAGYDSNVTRERLGERGFTWNISKKGERTRGLHGKRYRVEVLNAHHNSFARLRITDEIQMEVQEFWVRLANCILILRKLKKERTQVAS